MQEPRVQEHDQSDFNSAIATLMRIDEIKKQILIASAKEDYLLHYRFLFDYYKELSAMFNKVHSEEQTIKFIWMKNQYYTLRRCLKFNRKAPISCYTDLDLWEIDLRKLEQEYGMNMPKKQDARWALASR